MVFLAVQPLIWNLLSSKIQKKNVKLDVRRIIWAYSSKQRFHALFAGQIPYFVPLESQHEIVVAGLQCLLWVEAQGPPGIFDVILKMAKDYMDLAGDGKVQLQECLLETFDGSTKIRIEDIKKLPRKKSAPVLGQRGPNSVGPPWPPAVLNFFWPPSSKKIFWTPSRNDNLAHLWELPYLCTYFHVHGEANFRLKIQDAIVKGNLGSCGAGL